jgi:hypothetical protein
MSFQQWSSKSSLMVLLREGFVGVTRHKTNPLSLAGCVADVH